MGCEDSKACLTSDGTTGGRGEGVCSSAPQGVVAEVCHGEETRVAKELQAGEGELPLLIEADVVLRHANLAGKGRGRGGARQGDGGGEGGGGGGRALSLQSSLAAWRISWLSWSRSLEMACVSRTDAPAGRAAGEVRISKWAPRVLRRRWDAAVLARAILMGSRGEAALCRAAGRNQAHCQRSNTP